MARNTGAAIHSQRPKEGMVPGVNKPTRVQDGDLASGVVIVLLKREDAAVAGVPPNVSLA